MMAIIYNTIDGFKLKSNDALWVIGVSVETGKYCPAYYHVNEAMNEGLEGYKERVNAKQKCDELNSKTMVKYPIGGYAPGNYWCTCATCKEKFQGDKRAVQCEPCASVSQTEYNALSEEEKEDLEIRYIELNNQFIKDFRDGKD